MRRTFLAFAAAALIAVPFLAADSAYAQRDRFDRRIEIVNHTGVTIRTVNSTNVGRSDWGVDLLGDSVIPPGRSLIINVEDNTGYCLYDFRAILETGRRVTRFRVNVCEATAWIVR